MLSPVRVERRRVLSRPAVITHPQGAAVGRIRPMRGPIETFDYEELAELHRIYEDTCSDLNIGYDRARRDEVAAATMDLAKAGERNAEAIRRGVQRKFNGVAS